MEIRAANVGLIGLWAAWAAPLLPWLGRGFLRDDGVAQGLVAGLMVAWVASGVDPRAAWARLGRAPEALPLAVVLALAGPLLAVAVGSVHETVHAVCAVIGGYGLLGLYTGETRWRSLRPALLLALATLPVLLIVDVILGWPLRKGIASVAAAVLGGIPSETVIRVEGGMAHVDVPCAGFRGLWAFSALLLLATLVRGRTIDRRWVAGFAVGTGALIAANIGRVVVIVGLGHVLGWPMLAESVHEPLGVVGFLVSLGAAAAAGGLFVTRPEVPSTSRRAELRVLPVVVGLAMLLALVHPAPARVPEQPRPLAVPVGWEPMTPSEAEITFAARHGAGLAKARLPDLGASIVLVESRSWLAHHVPEHCLRAAGWTVAGDHPAWVGGRSVRVETVTRDGVQATAVWWFQAGDQTTDDLVVRIREGWRTGERWVLVSVLIPGVHDLAEPELDELVRSVRMSVGARAPGGES